MLPKIRTEKFWKLLAELPSPFCYKIRLGHIEVEGDNGILLYDQFGKVVAKAEATPDMLR